MKKLLITGSSGLLGSACLKEFTPTHQIIPCKVRLERYEPIANLIADTRPNIIIHCAARVGGVKANRDYPVDFLLDNLHIQNNVMQAAHLYGVEQLCFVATSCMFPKDAALPVHENSLFTGKLEDSVEAYAIAKIAGWRLAKAYWEQYGHRFITVAPSNIYGPNDNYGPQAHVIPSLIQKYAQAIQSQTNLEVWGDGTAIREFIHSSDVAKAIRVCLEKWNSPEVINIGTGEGTSIKEIAELITQTCPLHPTPRPELVFCPDQPTGIPRKTFDITQLKNLGWEPTKNLTEGLQETWRDFLLGNCRENQQLN